MNKPTLTDLGVISISGILDLEPEYKSRTDYLYDIIYSSDYEIKHVMLKAFLKSSTKEQREFVFKRIKQAEMYYNSMEYEEE